MGSGVGCVGLCCGSPLCLNFVGFFILFGLWCRLRCVETEECYGG